MAILTVKERLQSLALSASEIVALTNWSAAMVEDYLNIIDNISTLSEYAYNTLEAFPTEFTTGSIPFAKNGVLTEDNTNLFWDSASKLFKVKALTILGMTAGRVPYYTSEALGLVDSLIHILINNIGIAVATPTARLHLPAGTVVEGTGPLKLSEGPLVSTPEKGLLEFDGCAYTVTNLAQQRRLDRSSDVAVETVTVENTITETALWIAELAANSLTVGNTLKLSASGTVQNGGHTAADRITLRIRSGGLAGAVLVTLNPTGAIAAASPWHLHASVTQRTIGITGQRAIHFELSLDGAEVEVIGIVTVDTTAIMDIVLTAEWASEDVNNTISLYQGIMEYKN